MNSIDKQAWLEKHGHTIFAHGMDGSVFACWSSNGNGTIPRRGKGDTDSQACDQMFNNVVETLYGLCK